MSNKSKFLQQTKQNKNSNLLIRKLGTDLNKQYEDYLDEKKIYLNEKIIVEYLFNKPFTKITTLKALSLLDYRSAAKIVRLNVSDPNYISKNLILMAELQRRYSKANYTYEQLINKKNTPANKNILKFNYLPTIMELSTNEVAIMKVLDSINQDKKDRLLYVYKWNFLVEGEHTSLTSTPTVNYEQPFVYDFYGCTMSRNQLVQFVILYDDDTHFDKNDEQFVDVHQNDIMKQYMLSQMNIHLLRLSEKSNIKKEINTFIRQIKNTTEYVLTNGIVPIAKLFISNEENEDLVAFCRDYQYNHVIYLKYPTKNKKEPSYDSDDDEFFDYQIIKDNYSDKPSDESAIVSTDFLKKLMKEKTYPHKPKKSANEMEADQMIVELIGHK